MVSPAYVIRTAGSRPGAAGPGWDRPTQRISADGVNRWRYADAAALEKAGFLEFFYYERGRLTLEARLSEDEEAVEPLSVNI